MKYGKIFNATQKKIAEVQASGTKAGNLLMAAKEVGELRNYRDGKHNVPLTAKTEATLKEYAII